MSKPDGGDDSAAVARTPYSQYQVELYARAILMGEHAPATTDPNKLEEQARQKMSSEGFNYVFGGAGEQSTMQSNRLAFRQWKLIPRFLRPTVPRDLRVELFGKTYGKLRKLLPSIKLPFRVPPTPSLT